MSALQNEINRLKTLQGCYNELTETNSAIYSKLQKQLIYNEETGCLTITNANINIE
jgi:hypothetical protein